MKPDVVGYIGIAFLGVTLVPQVVHTYKTKKVDDLSLPYILLQLASNCIYIYYGYLIHALPIIVCNGLVGLLSSCLLFAKIKYRHPDYLII
jgi:MtN3 and saliva related transmembrane protein